MTRISCFVIQDSVKSEAVTNNPLGLIDGNTVTDANFKNREGVPDVKNAATSAKAASTRGRTETWWWLAHSFFFEL